MFVISLKFACRDARQHAHGVIHFFNRIITTKANAHQSGQTHARAVDDILLVKKQVQKVHISEELKTYIVQLVHTSRSFPGLVLGAGPRASLSLMQTARALALFDRQDFVTPDHIQEIAVPVIAHRLVLDPQARFSGQNPQSIVEEILETVPVPV